MVTDPRGPRFTVFGSCLGCEIYLLAHRATSHDIVGSVPKDRIPHSPTEVAA